jgi:two-component system sensor histidine kinase KdpD
VSLGLALDRRSLIGATSLCLLAVVAAAAYGGRRTGMAASVVAFLSLNFFFTGPYHTFTVARLADLIALFVFLAVSVIVGALLARVLEERERAQRRVVEAHFLDRITARLISGDRPENALGEFARDLVGMFDLDRCEIHLTNRPEPIVAGDGSGEREAQRLEVVLGAGGALGTVVAMRAHGAPAFGTVERSFLQALAAQAALALERASLDDEVHRARLDSEAAGLRAALFSSVTHDLRTPLASIKASASGLLDASASYSEAQRDDMLRTVVEEADRLNRIVANLLDLARMRAGALTPTRQPIWIHDLVNAVLARMGRRLEGFDVRVNLRGDLPPIYADSLQMDQVLTNIVENAARFSPPGAEIAITAARWQGTVQLRVADRGPGIAAEDRTRVFEEFYRKDAGGGRGGSGLGLAIARAIVVGHDGRIWVEGAPAGGAVLVVEMPETKTPEDSETRVPEVAR